MDHIAGDTCTSLLQPAAAACQLPASGVRMSSLLAWRASTACTTASPPAAAAVERYSGAAHRRGASCRQRQPATAAGTAPR
eukprot:2593868-Prymnesium_polylepis.3